VLVFSKWVCLSVGVIYTIDNIRNRIKGYGVDFSRIFLMVGGIIGFFVCHYR